LEREGQPIVAVEAFVTGDYVKYMKRASRLLCHQSGNVTCFAGTTIIMTGQTTGGTRLRFRGYY
jgi:hypothetical protein